MTSKLQMSIIVALLFARSLVCAGQEVADGVATDSATLVVP